MRNIISGRSAWQTAHANHVHEVWEVVVNTDGEGVLEVNGEPVPFGVGTIVCIPPHIGHAKYSPEGFRDLWIQIPDFPSLDPTKPTFLTDDSRQNITALFRVLYSVQYSKAPHGSVIVDSLLDSIEQMILSRLERKPLDARVEQIANHIVHHFQSTSFSVDRILADGGYCPDHMRRLFREQLGMTPHEYLLSVRIRTAKRLLAARHRTHYSIAEISVMVGFADPSYFSRIFKKKVGVAPNEYVEQ